MLTNGYLGGQQACQVDFRQDLLAVTVPVRLLGLHQLVVRQDLERQTFLSDFSECVYVGGAIERIGTVFSGSSPRRTKFGEFCGVLRG